MTGIEADCNITCTLAHSFLYAPLHDSCYLGANRFGTSHHILIHFIEFQAFPPIIIDEAIESDMLRNT